MSQTDLHWEPEAWCLGLGESPRGCHRYTLQAKKTQDTQKIRYLVGQKTQGWDFRRWGDGGGQGLAPASEFKSGSQLASRSQAKEAWLGL